MKKITLLLLGIFTLCISFSASAQCNHSITLTDSWGDGWNGVSSIDVLVDGEVVLDDIAIADGTTETFTFLVDTGQVITTAFNPAAQDGAPDYAGECSYEIFNFTGASIFAAASGTDPLHNGPADLLTADNVLGSCPSCTVAVIDSSTIVESCNPNGTGTFTVDHVVSGAGDAGSVLDDGTMTYPLVAGTVTTGPYNIGDSVTVEVTGVDPSCDFTVGTFSFICPPTNVDCASATPITCGETINTASVGSTGNQEGSGCSIGDNGIWFTFTGTGGELTLESNADFDHEMAISSGACGTLVHVGCDDGSTGTETYIFDSVLDETYFVYIAHYASGNTTTGIVDITLTCVAPPLCSAAVIDSSTIVDACNPDGTGTFTVDIVVSDTGDAGSVFDDGTTTYPVVAGTVTAGPYNSGDSVTIELTATDTDCSATVGTFEFTCPPANDDFANATAIDCLSGTITGSTDLATLDEDDAPDGGGADLDAPNVWFSLDSSVDGASDVTINLCGSNYDTSVLVYTGTSGDLTFVAANDDNNAACGQCCQSLVTFPTDGTTTYYITVEGYNFGSTGDFHMLVSCVTATPAPDNDDCADAVALSPNVSVSGTTVGATTSPGDAPTCDSFGSIADVWYSVDITGGTSNLSISTTITGTSDQANVAVYDDCAALAANSLGCSDGNAGETLDVLNLDNGTYYVRVWSDGNAAPPPTQGRIEGTFDIVLNTTLSTEDVANAAAFTYYPNPVKNTLVLNAQNTIENVAVYNMLGQVVLNAAPKAIASDLDMSNLQAGTYFVKVTIANVTKTVRVIKQ
jgi:hypothetical protein